MSRPIRAEQKPPSPPRAIRAGTLELSSASIFASASISLPQNPEPERVATLRLATAIVPQRFLVSARESIRAAHFS